MRAVVLLIALGVGGLAGYSSYHDPSSAARVASTAATVLAVLASVSLAIFSILAVRSRVQIEDNKRERRINNIIDTEDSALVDQNLAIFVALIVSLGLCLATAFVFPVTPPASFSTAMKWLAATAGFGTGLSIVLALLLPGTLVGIVRRNRGIS